MKLTADQWLILFSGILGMGAGAGILGFVLLHVVATIRKALDYDTPFGDLNPRMARLLASLLGQQAIQPFHSPTTRPSFDTELSGESSGEDGEASVGYAPHGEWNHGGFDGGGIDGGDF